MSTTETLALRRAVAPYLCARDASRAIAFYQEAFGATVTAGPFVGPDGRVGHAELEVEGSMFMIADEYPEIGVLSPQSVGGTPVQLQVDVADADTFVRRAAEAGATVDGPVEDRDYGARSGGLVDPFGHKWIVSTPTEQLDPDQLVDRLAGGGFDLAPGADASPVDLGERKAPAPAAGPRFWSVLVYRDAPAAITFLVDAFGFEEHAVYARESDPDVIEHAELRWPGGGGVMLGTAGRDDSPFARRTPGNNAVYLVCDDPGEMFERATGAGATVVRGLSDTDYGSREFSVADPEGNLWSFGTYAGA